MDKESLWKPVTMLDNVPHAVGLEGDDRITSVNRKEWVTNRSCEAE